MDDKENLAKKYAESKKETYEILEKINAFDGIKVLLSLMETLDAELVNQLRNVEVKNLHNRAIHLGMLENISTHVAIIREILVMLLLFSNVEKTELSKIPIIATLFTTDKSDHEMQDWMDKEFDEEKDHVISTTMQLLDGSYKARRFILIKDYHVISGTEQIPIIIDLLRKYSTLRSLRSILSLNIPANITSKGNVSFHNPDPVSSVIRKGMHPRQMTANEKFPLWKDDILKISKEGLISTELSRYAPKQKRMQDLEHIKFFEKFIKIPEIAKMFEKQYGISLIKFRDITLAIKQIALSSAPPVVSVPKPRLISKLKKLSRCSKIEIKKVLDLFILKPGDPVFARYIFTNGIECIYSWSLITFPLDSMMSEMYDKWADGNKKGIEFEIDCRKILESESCIVLNDRLQVPSINSDIDVVGKSNDVLFVIECKSEPRKKKRSITQVHEFERYYKKILKNAEWVSENFDVFSKLLNGVNFPSTENVKFVVPLLVTRTMQLNPSTLLTISTSELKEILSKIHHPKNGFIEIILNSHETIQIPALQVKKSTDM